MKLNNLLCWSRTLCDHCLSSFIHVCFLSTPEYYLVHLFCLDSIADAVLENDERCPAIIDFLRDVAYLDIEHATNHQRRPLDSVDNINHASDLSFAIVQEVLSKSSELRALTIASRFVMPYLLFWVCGSTKLTIAGTLPAVLRDARTVTVRFLSSRVDVTIFVLFCGRLLINYLNFRV